MKEIVPGVSVVNEGDANRCLPSSKESAVHAHKLARKCINVPGIPDCCHTADLRKLTTVYAVPSGRCIYYCDERLKWADCTWERLRSQILS